MREFDRDAGSVRVTINDDDAADSTGFDRIFYGLNATMAELPAILRDALPAIRAAHKLNFTTEGASGRGHWAGLADWTIRERLALGYGTRPILKRTGALRAHVLGTPARTSRTGDTAELRIKPSRMVAGVPKYRALAKGYAPGNLPGRPMVAIGPASATRVTSAIARSMRARARANGLDI